MEEEELKVLFKMLRGASSIPNVTFVCAFDREVVQQRLKQNDLYFEKFFPLTMTVPRPDSEAVFNKLVGRIQQGMVGTSWEHHIKGDQYARQFSVLWHIGLQKMCGNFRQAGLLANDVSSVGRSIAGQVNFLDAITMETIRRFFPGVFSEIVRLQDYLTGANPWSGEQEAISIIETRMNPELAKLREGDACRNLLGSIFPRWRFTSTGRPWTDDDREGHGRLDQAANLRTFLQAVVPSDVVSLTEIDEFLTSIEDGSNSSQRSIVFRSHLDSFTSSARREDFLRKIESNVSRLHTQDATRDLALAVAENASDSRSDSGEPIEIYLAVSVVLRCATLSTDPPELLQTTIRHASHDLLALVILEEAKKQNNHASFDVRIEDLQAAFVDRMRSRYTESFGKTLTVLTAFQWRPFYRWASSSEEDSQHLNFCGFRYRS
jgi:hypothetical protein